MVQKQERKE